MNKKNEENESVLSSIVNSILSAGVCFGLGVVVGISGSLTDSNM